MDGKLLFKGFRENITRIVLYNPYFNKAFQNIDLPALINNGPNLVFPEFQRLFVYSDTLKIPIQTNYYVYAEIQAVPVSIITDIPKHSSDGALDDNLIRLHKALTRDGIVFAEVLTEMSSDETMFAFTSLNKYIINYEPADTLRYIVIKTKAVIPAFETFTFDKTEFITDAESHDEYRFLSSNYIKRIFQHREEVLVVNVPMYSIYLHYIPVETTL